ncbi:MAG: hypothetical protein AB1779_03105 [Candidatus Thermoplasmatota archaeon]
MKRISDENILTELIGAWYEILADDKNEEVRKEFVYEVGRVELETLADKYGIVLPTYNHPLNAIKRFRELMCNAGVYTAIGDIKPRIIEKNKIQIRTWKCPYIFKCSSSIEKICIRGYSICYAIDTFSSSKFKSIKILDVGKECKIEIEVEYSGDLLKVPEEFLNEKAKILSIDLETRASIWLAGIEKGSRKIYGEKSSLFLKRVYEKFLCNVFEKYFKIEKICNFPIALWAEGKGIFNEKA